MKIVLCSVPGEPVHFVLPENVRAMGQLPVLPKYAISSLVRWMEKSGYTRADYDFFDIDMLLPSEEEIRQYFINAQPDVVGLSAVTSGTYGQIKRLARLIRSICPEALIVLGGNLSASANVVLRKTDIDICVAGDGEIAWVGLLGYAKKFGRTIRPVELAAIKGLAFLNPTSAELEFTGYGERLTESDMSLVPDYDLLRRGLQNRPELISNYFRPGRESVWFNHDARALDPARKPNMAFLLVSKGCIAKCTFCQRPTKGYRSGGIEELDRHVQYLSDSHDVGFVMVADENFGSDSAVAIEFAKLMKKHDILWAASGVRCDSVTRELIQLFAENNCVGMKFGVESGSQKILDLMEKKFRKEQVISAVSWCREYRIFSPLAIMFGMPGEDEATARETGRLIAEIALLTNTDPAEGKDLFYAIPFPGTPLYEYGQQIGVIGTTVDDEEMYLENLFSAPSYKLSYVNLNGAPVGEVLFWDVVAQMEAMRHYSAGSRQSPAAEPVAGQPAEPPPTQVGSAPKAEGIFGKESIWQIIARKIRTRRWRISMYPFATILIQRKIIPSTRATRIPAAILYPIVKALLLVEYYAIALATRRSGFNYYRFIVPKRGLERIGNDYDKAFPARKLVSLRNIVVSKREKPADLTEENRIKLMAGL